ncbi:hypothetical protein C8Q74DRAFT_1275392 [Fomes fomentarius]|nr:hypothetical protein C8Q74DRAFT_1275392 [Fomes fomentarius]
MSVSMPRLSHDPQWLDLRRYPTYINLSTPVKGTIYPYHHLPHCCAVFSSSYSTNVLKFNAMNPPAYLYTVDEYGELPYELTHRPLPFSAPYPFVSASFYPRLFVPAGPSPMRLDTTGLQYNFTAASFLDLDRQVVDSEKQPQEPVSSLSKQDTSERKPDVWVGEDEWFAGGKVEVEVAPDFPRYPTLAEDNQEATTTNLQDEVKAEEETGVLMEVVSMVSLEVLNGSRAQLPLPSSPKRVRMCTEDLKVTAAPRKLPRTQAYASKIKRQQEWLAPGFVKVKTALNRLAPSRLPRPTRTLRA